MNRYMKWLPLYTDVRLIENTLWEKRWYIQVCQIRVMTEFETITLTQDGAVDLKTIAVFLFPKFNRQPFFFRDRNLMQCLRSRSPRNKFINQKNYFTISLKLIWLTQTLFCDALKRIAAFEGNSNAPLYKAKDEKSITWLQRYAN